MRAPHLPQIDISVEAGAWPSEAELREAAEGAVHAAVTAVRAQENASRPVPNEQGEVSILFTGDAGIQALNRAYRSKDTPTNVLSFPQPPGPLLGDIVLAFETIEREAALAGKPFRAHMGHLIVHGFLHLLGFDHETEEEAEEMEALERAALKRMGLPDPYAAA